MGKSKINRKKVNYDGHLFDSKTEYEFYRYLKKQKEKLGIKEIILQPHFELIPEYKVICWRCSGYGKVYNEKTGNMNKCRRVVCDEGVVTKEAITYDADFKLIYENGEETVIDVKGYRGQDKKFNLKKRLFEEKFGIELIIITKTKGGWKWQT